MQNNMRIIGLKLNARMILLSHIFTHRDICAICQLRRRWRLKFYSNDARHRSNAASVHRRHELARPTAAFSPYFVVNRVHICGVAWQKVWWNKCSCHRVGDPETNWRQHSSLTLWFLYSFLIVSTTLVLGHHQTDRPSDRPRESRRGCMLPRAMHLPRVASQRVARGRWDHPTGAIRPIGCRS